MKNTLLILICLTILSCQKQQKYLITGNVPDIPDSTIVDLFLRYDNMGKRIKSDTIINGLFEFSDTLSSKPVKMNLRIRDRKNYYGSCNLWVNYEKIEVSGKGRYLSGWIVKSNIEEQKAVNRFQNKTRYLSIMTDSLFLVRSNNRENKKLSKLIRSEIDSISQIRRTIEFELIKQACNSQSALEKLYQITKFDTTITKEQIREVYNNLDTTYRNTLYGQGILSHLEKRKIPEIGDNMVDVEVFDLSGNKHRLTDYIGKYVLLDFWSMACYPCILAAPELRELNSNYNENLTVVGINMETNKEMWEQGTKRDSITWINLSDGKGTFAGASVIYGINGFPTYILINPEGVIVDRWMGFEKGIFKKKLGKHIEGMNI